MDSTQRKKAQLTKTIEERRYGILSDNWEEEKDNQLEHQAIAHEHKSNCFSEKVESCWEHLIFCEKSFLYVVFNFVVMVMCLFSSYWYMYIAAFRI